MSVASAYQHTIVKTYSSHYHTIAAVRSTVVRGFFFSAINASRLVMLEWERAMGR